MSFLFQALVAKLREGSGTSANSGTIAGVLVTVGDLARVVRTYFIGVVYTRISFLQQTRDKSWGLPVSM